VTAAEEDFEAPEVSEKWRAEGEIGRVSRRERKTDERGERMRRRTGSTLEGKRRKGKTVSTFLEEKERERKRRTPRSAQRQLPRVLSDPLQVLLNLRLLLLRQRLESLQDRRQRRISSCRRRRYRLSRTFRLVFCLTLSRNSRLVLSRFGNLPLPLLRRRRRFLRCSLLLDVAEDGRGCGSAGVVACGGRGRRGGVGGEEVPLRLGQLLVPLERRRTLRLLLLLLCYVLRDVLGSAGERTPCLGGGGRVETRERTGERLGSLILEGRGEVIEEEKTEG
jgi:hypothetical protein